MKNYRLKAFLFAPVLAAGIQGASPATAQNINDILKSFSGFAQQAMRQAAQSQWRSMPPLETACIDQSLRQQGRSVDALINSGILPDDPRLSQLRFNCRSQTVQQSPPAATQSPSYVVDGLALGGQVHFGTSAYQQYQCGPSDKFPGFTWCHAEKTEKTNRGDVLLSHSILHSQDGTAWYVNSYVEPAFFGPNDVQNEIDRLSSKFGQQARIIRMPHHDGGVDAVMSVWGAIQLEQLNADEISALASGGTVKGLSVSFLGDLERSAKEGVPVYRLAGGAGFLWVATFNAQGRGVLRYLTIDSTQIQSPTVATDTSSPQPLPPSVPSQHGTEQPSFDCGKATYPDEWAICSSPELSQLDVALVAAYQYVRVKYGDDYAKTINAPLFQARRACGSDLACIKERQTAAIKTFEALGAPPAAPVTRPTSAPAAPPAAPVTRPTSAPAAPPAAPVTRPTSAPAAPPAAPLARPTSAPAAPPPILRDTKSDVEKTSITPTALLAVSIIGVVLGVVATFVFFKLRGANDALTTVGGGSKSGTQTRLAQNTPSETSQHGSQSPALEPDQKTGVRDNARTSTTSQSEATEKGIKEGAEYHVQPKQARWVSYSFGTGSVIGGIFAVLLVVSIVSQSWGALVLIVLAPIYFLPTIIALKRRVAHEWAIILLNFFLGMTGVGWFGSLAWALMGTPASSFDGMEGVGWTPKALGTELGGPHQRTAYSDHVMRRGWQLPLYAHQFFHFNEQEIPIPGTDVRVLFVNPMISVFDPNRYLRFDYDVARDIRCVTVLNEENQTNTSKTVGRAVLTGLGTGLITGRESAVLGGGLLDYSLRGSEQRSILTIMIVLRDFSSMAVQGPNTEVRKFLSFLPPDVLSEKRAEKAAEQIEKIERLAKDGKRVVAELNDEMAKLKSKIEFCDEELKQAQTFSERDEIRLKQEKLRTERDDWGAMLNAIRHMLDRGAVAELPNNQGQLPVPFNAATV